MSNFQNPFTPEMLSQIKAGLKRYETLQKNDGFIILASLGWYIHGGMTMAHAARFMDMAIQGNNVEINKELISHYKEEIKDRAASFGNSKSKRSLIIKEGIDCHILGKYHASVSLFLSQADGITNGLLFKTKNRKKELKKLVAEDNENEFFRDILNVILRVNKIDEYFSKEIDSTTSLNRHAVLHGYDTNFGTEINGLKAFSLFLFVNDFLVNKKL